VFLFLVIPAEIAFPASSKDHDSLIETPSDAFRSENCRLLFDGVDDYVEMQDNTLDLFDHQLTVELWIQPSQDLNISSPRTEFIYKEWQQSIHSAHYGMNYSDNPGSHPGELKFQTWEDSSQVYVRYDFHADSLYHIAGVVTGDKVEIFINGQIVAERSYSGSSLPDSSDRPLWVGQRYDNLYNYPGYIDEIRISNIARYIDNFTPERHFASDEYTMALWHFDECSGDSTYDASGNANNGVIYGAQWEPGLPFVDFVLSPTGPTTVSRGDVLGFQARIANTTENRIEGDYWLSADLPDSGEILIPDDFLSLPNPLHGWIPSRDSLEFNEGLFIPAQADTGTYRLIGRIGTYPGSIFDEEAFQFHVVE
jgi:hypothetical protein